MKNKGGKNLRFLIPRAISFRHLDGNQKRGQTAIQIILVIILVVLLVILLVLFLNPRMFISAGKSYSTSSYGDSNSDSSSSYSSNYKSPQAQIKRQVCESVKIPYTVEETYLDYPNDYVQQTGYSYSNDDNYYSRYYDSYSSGVYGVSVKNVDEESGDFKVRFYYRDDYYGNTRTKTVTKNLDEGEREIFYFRGNSDDFVYSYRVTSEDDLDYIDYSVNENYYRHGMMRYTVEKTRQVLKYRDEVRCYLV